MSEIDHEWRSCFHPTTQQGGDGCHFFMRCHGVWPKRCNYPEQCHREIDPRDARIAALEAEVARLKLTTRSDREYAEMKQRAEAAEQCCHALREALRLARGALTTAHEQAGRPDPHYMVLDVTRIEIGRIDAALAASEGQEGE